LVYARRMPSNMIEVEHKRFVLELV
jgi:hypothetical protein